MWLCYFFKFGLDNLHAIAQVRARERGIFLQGGRGRLMNMPALVGLVRFRQEEWDGYG